MLFVAIAATRRSFVGEPISSGEGLARRCCAAKGDGGRANCCADETGACDVAPMGQFGMTPVDELAAPDAGVPCTVSIGITGDIGDAPWTVEGAPCPVADAPWTGGVTVATPGDGRASGLADRYMSAALAASGVDATPPAVRAASCCLVSVALGRTIASARCHFLPCVRRCDGNATLRMMVSRSNSLE